MEFKPTSLPHVYAAIAALVFTAGASASEGLRIRYPIIGSPGGEVVAPVTPHGWVGAVNVTHFETGRVTDDNGNDVKKDIPVTVGTFSTTTPGTVHFSQRQDTVNFVLGYLSENDYAGGRLSFGLNLPFHRIRRTVSVTAVAPTLPPALQSRAAQVDAGLQTQLAAQGAAASGEASGMGDAEISGLWIYRRDQFRLLAGATLVTPTGSYDAARTVNPGFGDYYTLRPTVAMVAEVSPGTTLAGRATLGLNGYNSATKYRSGNFTAFEASAIHKFQGLVAGVNVFTVRQYEDDVGPGVPAGGFRLKTSGVGPFVTTYFEQMKMAVTLAYSQNFDSSNGTPGKALRVRAVNDF